MYSSHGGNTTPQGRGQEHVPRLVVGSDGLAQRRNRARRSPGSVAGGQVDVCFVFDTTGSMVGKIESLIAAMADMVVELDRRGLDWRISVVPFGDLRVPRDRVDGDHPFTADVTHAQHLLRSMPRFSGGGNVGESSIEAMQAALAKPTRPGAVAALVLLTDDAAHQDRTTPAQLQQHLLDAEVVTFVVSDPLVYYQQWASATGGRWFDIRTSPDTDAILMLLHSLCRDVVEVTDAVHALTGGSVARYRALPPGQR